MPSLPRPPQTYIDFSARFPKLAKAWQLIGEAGKDGPLNVREVRLLKLGIALGAMREGAVHSNVRKGLAEGITREELEHVAAVAAGTLGMPSAVAGYTWILDCFDRAAAEEESG